MRTPELGSVSLEAYEEEKKYLVSPDRMCIDGVYSLMLFLGPTSCPEAFVMPQRVTSIKKCDPRNREIPAGFSPIQLCNGLYKITSYLEWPGVPQKLKSYTIDTDGILITRLDRTPSGGYFKHHFNEVDREFEEFEEFVDGRGAQFELQEVADPVGPEMPLY